MAVADTLRQKLTAAFQPIVEIVSGDIVAYEALARGPQRSPLQRPDRLFATASAAGGCSKRRR